VAGLALPLVSLSSPSGERLAGPVNHPGTTSNSLSVASSTTPLPILGTSTLPLAEDSGSCATARALHRASCVPSRVLDAAARSSCRPDLKTVSARHPGRPAPLASSHRVGMNGDDLTSAHAAGRQSSSGEGT
jgi:hypothetical protein